MKYLIRTPFYLILALAIFALIIGTSHSNWEEVPDKGATLDVGGLLNDKASSYTAQAMYAGEHAWVGLQANEIRADGEIISQTIDARVQGGKDFDLAGIQFFVEANRSMDTDLSTSTGGYIRKIITAGKL